MRSSAPFDTSLLTVRRFAPGLFLEYGKAVKARVDGRRLRRVGLVLTRAGTLPIWSCWTGSTRTSAATS